MRKLAGIVLARAFLITVAGLIVFLSHQPSLKPPMEWFPHQDKVFHLIEFGGLGLALVLNRDLFRGNKPRLKMFFCGFVWAILDELHQSFVPGRDCSLQDIAADTVGLLLAIWLFSKILTRFS